MQTRSNKRHRQDEEDTSYIPFSLNNFKESEYNHFAGQNICGFRDSNLEQEFQEAKSDTNEDLEAFFQSIYDAGCALIDLKIVIKNTDGSFTLNEDFGDYDSWKTRREGILKNCIFLKNMNHKLFC